MRRPGLETVKDLTAQILKLNDRGEYDQAFVVAKYLACQLRKKGKAKEEKR